MIVPSNRSASPVNRLTTLLLSLHNSANDNDDTTTNYAAAATPDNNTVNNAGSATTSKDNTGDAVAIATFIAVYPFSMEGTITFRFLFIQW